MKDLSSAGLSLPNTKFPAKMLRHAAEQGFEGILLGDRNACAIVHPLEFICVPLVRAESVGLCGHIWEGGRAAATIHSHSWHLYSDVVLGAIANQTFQVTPCQDDGHHVVRVHSAGLTDHMVPTGVSLGLSQTTAEVHTAGSAYGLAAGTYHRSMPMAGGWNLTLVQAIPVAGCHDQIVVRSLAERTVKPMSRRLLPESTARPLVAFFREALENSSIGRGRSL